MTYSTRRALVWTANLAISVVLLSRWARMTRSQRTAAVAAWAACRGVLLYNTMRANTPFLGPVVNRFDTREKEVWLTLDDGPDPEATPRILDVLDRHDARAVFFVIGERVRAHPELAREIAARGHELGNHTLTHPAATFWAASPRRLRNEVETANLVISEVTGKLPRFFRSPVGMANPFLHDVVEQAGLVRMGWTVRGYDAINRTGSVERILRAVTSGSIILFHGEGDCGKDGPERLEKLLVELRDRGLCCVLPDASPVNEKG